MTSIQRDHIGRPERFDFFCGTFANTARMFKADPTTYFVDEKTFTLVSEFATIGCAASFVETMQGNTWDRMSETERDAFAGTGAIVPDFTATFSTEGRHFDFSSPVAVRFVVL